MNDGVKTHQEGLKRPRWDDRPALYTTAACSRVAASSSSCGGGSTATLMPSPLAMSKKLLGLSTSTVDADMASAIVPPVTVVLEGRCICHRIHLSRHAGYQSLAAALRRMFVDMEAGDEDERGESKINDGLDLSNAVPGHMVAYEDMEDDLLLAGDLNWKDFVRVVKRIRIIPAKASRRRHCRGT